MKGSVGRLFIGLSALTLLGFDSNLIDGKNPAEYRNGILHGIRVILGKMDEKDLLAVMMYVGSMEGAPGEKQKTTTSAQPPPAVGSVTATARGEEATAITTVTVHPSPCPTTTTEAPANPTTTEQAANPTTEANHPTSATTTTVPPSPQDPAPPVRNSRLIRVLTTKQLFHY